MASTGTEELISQGLHVFPSQGKVAFEKQDVRLGPVNMKVLVVLLKADGDVVSRKQLCAQVWPNQLVSDETLTKCISDIRVSLNKLAAGKAFIRTIPKIGYQWLLPVTQPVDAAPRQSKPGPSISFTFIAGVICLILFSMVLWNWLHVPDKGEINIVVLPLRTDSEEGRLAAGLLEDKLRAIIVQSDSLNLMSTEVVSGLKQRPTNYLRGEFGINWALEGRVRSLPGGIRVSLSLVDLNTAIVIHTRTGEFVGSEEEISDFTRLFASDATRLLHGSDVEE